MFRRRAHSFWPKWDEHKRTLDYHFDMGAENFGGDISVLHCVVWCTRHVCVRKGRNDWCGRRHHRICKSRTTIVLHRVADGGWRMGGPCAMYFARAFSNQDQRRNKTTCALFLPLAPMFIIYAFYLFPILHMHASFECPAAVAAAATAAASLGVKSRSSIKHFLSLLLLLNSYVCVRRCCFLALFSMADRLVEC